MVICHFHTSFVALRIHYRFLSQLCQLILLLFVTFVL
nr:MAG TPA: hypothetical protein [Caudoviricetes sp.]